MDTEKLLKEENSKQRKAECAKSLKDLRQVYGLSLEGLSERTGIPNQTLSRYERGINEPSVFQAYKIAAAFGVTIEEMLLGELNFSQLKNSK